MVGSSVNLGTDSVTTTTGAGCTQSLTPGSHIEAGIYTDLENEFNRPYRESVGVFAKIVIPLGQKKIKRIDCNRLYNNELRAQELDIRRQELNLRRLELEVELLEEQIANERNKEVLPSGEGDDW